MNRAGGGAVHACGDTGPDGEPFKLSGASTSPAPPTVSVLLGTIGATGKLKFNPVIQLGPLKLSIEFTAQGIQYSLADGLVLGTPQDVLAINAFL